MSAMEWIAGQIKGAVNYCNTYALIRDCLGSSSLRTGHSNWVRRTTHQTLWPKEGLFGQIFSLRGWSISYLYHGSDRDGQTLKLGIVSHHHNRAVHLPGLQLLRNYFHPDLIAVLQL